MNRARWGLLLAGLFAILLSGCGGNSGPAEGYEELGGWWNVGYVYSLGELVDVRENETLYDLYDSQHLSFEKDGTFSYYWGAIHEGTYRKTDDYEGFEAYFLNTTESYRNSMQDGELVQIPTQWEPSAYMAIMMDENVLWLVTCDSTTGRPMQDDTPILYVRESS